MSHSSLDLVWRSSDVDLPGFTGEEVGSWPEETCKALSDIGLLQEWNTAAHAVCTACAGEHVEEVTPLSYPDGTVRFFVVCPNHGRIEVEPPQILQWTVSYTPVLDCLRRDLCVTGDPVEIVPSRLWNLGRSALAGQSRPVWFGRGLSWPDASSFSDDLPRGASPVLLYFGRPPRAGLVDLKPDSVIDAARAMSIADGTLVFDRHGVEEQLSAQRRGGSKKVPRKRAPRAAAMEALKKAIREHLRAARDHAYNLVNSGKAPALLPRPTQEVLAKQLHLSRPSVSRALADGSDEELTILWEAAAHLDQVMKFKDRHSHSS